MNQEKRIYLASRSPRRRELLAQIGVRFDVLLFRAGIRADIEVDEAFHPGEAAHDYVRRVALAKANHGMALVRARRLPRLPLLAADTTLDFGGEIIGKPEDAADAEAILRRLSGKTHRVLTAVAVHDGKTAHLALSDSEVRFRAIEEAEIRRYVQTGEPMDKAGAYGIQGRAAIFVESIHGSHSGIVGLPLCETSMLLARCGIHL